MTSAKNPTSSIGGSVKIPFCKPYIQKEEIKAVIDTLKSGWLTMGPKTKKFEEALCEYSKAKYCACVDSCTSALHISLIASGVGPGDEVITTPFTYVATAHSILYCGAEPVFVDIDEKTFNINPDLIEAKITKRTKAILPVHYAGEPCDMVKINKIAHKYRLKVVEDGAHAMGAKYHSKNVGNGKNPVCFSFYPVKNMTAAEGGAILSNDKKFIRKVKKMRSFGWINPTSSFGNDIEEIGFKYNMTDIQAAIGLQQLRKLDMMNAKRAVLMRIFLRDWMITQYHDKNSLPSCHILPILVKDRDGFIKFFGSKGIATSIHFQPIPTFTLYEKLGYNLSDYPVTKKVFLKTVTLPVYPSMTMTERDYINQALDEWERKHEYINNSSTPR